MTDPLTGAATAATLGRGALGVVEFLWDKVREADVIAREFDPDGRPFDVGDERINVRRINQDSTHWWYSVILVVGFEFVPFATNPHFEIRLGTLQGDLRPRDRIAFRWVIPPALGFVFNQGEDRATVETNFVIVGYRPAAIVRHFSARAATG
jgi:hypothetical protein